MTAPLTPQENPEQPDTAEEPDAPAARPEMTAPQAEAPVAPPVPTTVLPLPVRRKWTMRHTVVAAAIALVVAAVATGVTLLARDPVSGAEERVLGYFAALAEGDGPAAGMFLQGVEGSESPIWEPDGLVEGYRAPENVEVTSAAEGAPPGVAVEDDREYATVTVAYTVDGRPASELFVLSRLGDGNWNIIAARLGRIEFEPEFATGPNFAQVSASPITVHAAGASALSGMAVPPGVITVSIKDDLLYEDFTIEVPVAPGTAGMQGIEPVFPPELTVDDSAKEAVNEQVKTAIDTCAQTGNLPGDSYGSGNDCPWKSDEPFTSLFFLDGAWTVDAYPEIDVVMDDEGRLEVVTVTPGSATYEDGTTVVDLAPTGPVYRYEGEIVWVSEDPNR